MPPEILIVGTGPGAASLLTREAENALLASGKVFFRTSAHPVYQWLSAREKPLVPLDFVYALPKITYDQVYQFIAEIIVREAALRGHATYALPGHPSVFEATPTLIRKRAEALGMTVKILPGLSFLEVACGELGVDPVAGLQIASAFDFQSEDLALTARQAVLIGQVFAGVEPQQASSTGNLGLVNRWLRRHFPPDHPVSLVWTPGMPAYETYSKTFPLSDLVPLGEDLKNVARLGTLFANKLNDA